MSDEEHIRAAFAEFRVAVLPHIRPPGVEAAHRTLRRRSVVRTAAAASGCAAVLMAAGLALASRASPPQELHQPFATAYAATSPSASPAPPPPHGVTRFTVSTEPSCDSRGQVHVTGHGLSKIIFMLHNAEGRDGTPLCRELRLRVFWASYAYQPDGSQTLYAHEEFVLTPGRPHQTSVAEHPICGGDVYFVAGDYAIVESIPPKAHHPYPQGVDRGVFEAHITEPRCQDATPSPSASPIQSPPGAFGRRVSGPAAGGPALP